MRVLLIDADIYCYEVASANEQEIRWDDDIHTLHSDFTVCKAQLKSRIASLKDRLKADKVVMVISSNLNFRKSVYDLYKSKRPSRKPLCLAALKEYAKDNYESYTYPELEGDDVLGILMTDPEFYPGAEKIIVSLDKDFKTIPGKHYNFRQDRHFEVNEEEADFWHLYQTLMGDNTDGYPGCPGVGPDTAMKYLSEKIALQPYEHTLLRGKRKGEVEIRYEEVPADTLWEVVVSLFKAKGLGEEFALTMARCARILRHGDYDTTTGELKLWHPTH